MSAFLFAVICQLAAAAPEQLLVRGHAATRSIAIEPGADGARVRADLLAAPLGGSFRLQASGHFRLDIGGKGFDFIDGAPFARVGDVVHPMTGAPLVHEGHAWVPLHFVTEVLQRAATGFFYDPVYLELRQFGSAATRARTVANKTPTSKAPAPRRGAATPTARRTQPAPPRRKDGRHVIVIDAGHGGRDGGMHGKLPGGRRIDEKDITLQVSRRLASVLRERGYEVVMTRSTDTLIALSDRGRIANEARGDLFLSIHVNAANPRWKNPSAARGLETYFLSTAKTDDERRVEQMENEAVRFETDTPANAGDPLSFVLTDMQQNEHLRESSDLADIVQRELAGMHPGPNRGVKQAGFRVLVTAYMPAVLIELGFGTNPGEAAFMTNALQQRRMADAIARAADEYFERYERRVGGGAGGQGAGGRGS